MSLGTTKSFIHAIEQIRQDMEAAEKRHQRLKDEFEHFKHKYHLNSTAMQNMQRTIVAQGGE